MRSSLLTAIIICVIVGAAGGLVIASDHDAARAYAGVLRRLTGTRPVVVLSDERADSPISPYTRPRNACAIANCGSISVARLKRGSAAGLPFEERTLQAAL